MSDTQKPTLPADMIDRAARAIAAPGMFDDPPAWKRSDAETYRQTYREYARAALAAALDGCEVREQWRATITTADGDETDGPWCVTRKLADEWQELYAAGRAGHDVAGATLAIEHRLVITVPAVVSDERPTND